MNEVNVLSVDIDYCIYSNDMNDLFDVVCKAASNIQDKNKILFSQYHVDILDLIKKINQPINIYNIDLHHDIFYENETSIAEVKSGVVSSADWVLWALLNKRVESYTWIKQPTSDEFSEDMIEVFNKAMNYCDNYGIVDSRNLVFSSKRAFTHPKGQNFIKQKPKIFTNTRAVKSLEDIDLNYLFVCLSPDYTPKENYFLYNICKTAVDHIFKNRNYEKKIQDET